ncbi:MAG: glycosyltransferase family 4 protein [bacterium]|nr:glycosyltransferase family 4 protein [bacterium]
MAVSRANAPSILLALTGLSIDGGIASVSRSIVDVLERARDEGRSGPIHRVLLLEEHGTPRYGTGEGRESRAAGSQARFVLQLWREILRGRPDFVLFDHVGPVRGLFPGWPLPLPLPRPEFRIFVHGLELRGADSDRRADALRGARSILSNSDFTNEMLSEMIPEIASKITTVPLCVEPQRIREWNDRRPDSVATARRRPAALIVGRMWKDQPGKGHEALIDGWSRVVERVPDAELWIVGQGDQVEELEARATACGVAESVVFQGRVSDERLSELYAEASVFAMPSAQEGFGLVYLEAMWHGLPCVASTMDAGRFVVDEESGVLVPYADPEATAEAIATLLSDPEGLERRGRLARARVETSFSFDAFEANLCQALGLAKPSGPAD